MSWKAAKTSALLSLLFLVVYGSCNWLTALRHDVGSFYFAWERHIPFVPAMILPYMSIDLFFIAAPFLCRDDGQRRMLANRITAAILIAGVCFLLFPLRFAFDRPQVDGWLGAIFDSFRSLDQPFNQFPSLHITLRTILAAFYVGVTHGGLRPLVRLWFSLIGFSTVLTYQHHVIDVVGGFALAGLCFYLFRDESLRLPVIVNRRVGLYYAACTIVLAALAFMAGPGSWLLLWPAASLGLVAAAYFGMGPGIFRKSRGRLPASSWLMLWPVLLGQRLSLIHYARQCRPWDVLTDRLWIGRKLSNAEAREAVAHGVTAVLDLTGEFSEARPFLAVAYRPLPVMDLTAPTPSQLDQAVAFIREQSARGVVYVHCKIGYSRTAAVAGAYLLASGQARTVEQALAILRAARPAIVIRPEAVTAIRAYPGRPSVEAACSSPA
jgi:membrane-associated phospholipid phosphatase